MSACSILLILLLALRNLLLALVVLVPLLLAALLTFGIAVFAGISINMANILVLPLNIWAWRRKRHSCSRSLPRRAGRDPANEFEHAESGSVIKLNNGWGVCIAFDFSTSRSRVCGYITDHSCLPAFVVYSFLAACFVAWNESSEKLKVRAELTADTLSGYGGDDGN